MQSRITMMRILCVAVLVFGVSSLAPAQTPVQVEKVELSIPFGSPVPGKIVLIDNYLLFVDDFQTEASFAIHRANIKDMNFSQDNLVSVSCDRPVRDRSGERSIFDFRLSNGVVALQSWFNAQPTTSRETIGTDRGTIDTGEVNMATLTYQAQHDHFIGSCKGTLTVTQTRMTYDAPENVEHSRQWQLRDIKEVKQQGPYVLEIEPFTGSKYKLRLLGSGMDVRDYKLLLARISAVRADR